MSDVHYIFRRARREDIWNSMPLWAKDRVLYDADVWTRLPALLEDLVQRELVSFAFIESLPSRAPQLFGGISFIRPEYLKARAGPATLPNCVMQAALRNHNPFLSPREVGEENAHGELHLLPLFGNMDAIDLAEPDLANLYRTSNEGFRFFVFGHSLRAMWMEVSPPHHVEELKQQGMLIDRQLPLAGGKTATLLRLKREEALANPYARFCSYFFPPKPRFAFSLGEQRLLEYALLDVSDEEIAEELHLSEDAIKKRWRSIYVKIETADTKLLFDITSGTGRRRSVLHYLRQHLEELRPYRENHGSQGNRA
jgi:DNA-binding CsgD family transcriptional regulator